MREKRGLGPTVLVSVFIVAALVLFFPESRAYAASTGDKVALFFIENFMYPVVQFLANVLIVVINILVAVAQYNGFINAPAVEKGWVIVRDLSNMFFIVFLLIIAFGTIFKIEAYRYNRILGKLVIFAFLINFSKFVAGFWIDIGQVIMLTFVNGFKDAAAGNLASGLGLDKTLELSNSPLQNIDITSKALYGAIILALILLGIAVVVTLIITVLLLYRIVMLWILIVFSPLAFLTRIFPNTTKYSDQWWGEFNKNIIVGPVLAFFLWLSLTVIATSNGNLATDFQSVSTQETTGLLGTANEAGEGTGQTISAAITTIGESDRLLSYMITIGLLLGSLQAAQQLGAAGGRWAGSMSEKLKTGGLSAAGVLSGVAAARLALRGGKAGAERVGSTAWRTAVTKSKVGNRQILAPLTRKYWEGYAQRGAEQQQVLDRRMMARGRTMADIVRETKLYGGGGDLAVGTYIEDTERALINEGYNEKQKSLGKNPSSEKVVQEMWSAKAQKGEQGITSKNSGALLGARNGNWDDLNQMMFFNKELKSNIEKYGPDPDQIPADVKSKLLEEWGFSTDSAIDEWEDVVNESSKHMRVIMMNYLGLSRKYDPEYLAAQEAQKRGKNIHIMRREGEAGDAGAAKEYKEIMQKSQQQAMNEAKNAGIDDRNRLIALQWAGDEALSVGQHVEQRHGLFNEEEGYSYIGTLEKMADDSYGLLNKTESSKVMERMSPHAITPRYFDTETGEIDYNTDASEWSEIGKRMFKFFGKFTNREIGRMSGRVGEQIIGLDGVVGKKNVIFDAKGQFYEGEGTDEEKKARRAESQRRWEAMYSQDSLSAKKLYMKVFTGSADGFKDWDKGGQTIKGWTPPAPTEAEKAAVKKAEAEENTETANKATGEEKTSTSDTAQKDETKSPGGVVLTPGAQFKAEQEGEVKTSDRSSQTPSVEPSADEKAPYNREHMQASDSYGRLANSLTAYHDELPKSADELRTTISELGRNVTDAVDRLNNIQSNVKAPDLKNEIGGLVDKLKTHQENGESIRFNRTPADEQREFFKRSTELLGEVGKVIKKSVKEK
ncbi:MAG: type IV secretion system protein [Candidatus Nomurabacteria bacterium]|nr:MAG: type IV secretion system protein [Candidatus Nomurabacteria bacterium]